jgi:starvation-inducible DNA-binding protein
MEIQIGMESEAREAVISQLKTLLADHYVLYTKARNYHWNVEGASFHDLHVFFEGLYTQLEIVVDDLAERIRALGGNAPGTLQEFLQYSRLKEYPNFYPAWPDMVQDLIRDYETLCTTLREEIPGINDKSHDLVTADYLTGLLRDHEKNAWMMRSMLKG